MKMILQIVWAVVSASTGFLRSAPDYESSLDTQLAMGTIVTVDKTDRYWCHATSKDPAYSGWINDIQLAFKTEEQISEYIAAPKFICTAEHAYIHEDPSEDSGHISDIVMGELVRRTGVQNGSWTKVRLANDAEGWIPSRAVEPFDEWTRTREPSFDNLYRIAKKFRGTTYMWGGTSIKYVDCSGLTRNLYFMNGILLPRDASQQVLIGKEIPLDMSQWQPGDLLFFGTPATKTAPMKVGHVAMYLGDGRLIHASKLVRENSLIPGSADFYERKVIAVRRMLGQEGLPGGPVRLVDSPWYFKQ